MFWNIFFFEISATRARSHVKNPQKSNENYSYGLSREVTRRSLPNGLPSHGGWFMKYPECMCRAINAPKTQIPSINSCLNQKLRAAADCGTGSVTLDI